jgi:serine/threonine protein kinase/tetratricopeptide (TPR) repeat protein
VPDVLDRLKSALADRYAVERELGSGGMATVYLAEDLKHHRKVAVKVLRPELAAALGAERFLQEIQVTARLSHPHIVPLHDSGAADGFLYYVMPYVAGESLRQRLERETQLPVDEALRIIRQVASALEFAHKQNVIHRDVKPENVLLHEGEAMVADFGIALAVSAAGGERLTETGISVGTPEYMSPEQALGEGEPDARSDIYSLGCVLYEMLVGEPPYTGPTGMAVLAKRLSDPVPRARRLRGAIPASMDAALLRALAKERADRFGSAGEFAEALVAEVAETAEAVKSIVVLPFANLSPDPENEYFSDGLTEEIITDLSKIRALRVISRNSAMQLKGTDKDTKTIGRELGVQYVLEGSVRKAGNRLRITAQLIDAQDDVHCWAEKYDGVLEDVFDMQEQVSRAIANALKLTLSPEEDRRLGTRQIENVEAYQWYLRARQETWLATPEALDRARQHIQHGLDIIGENALLLAGMGYVYAQYTNLGLEHEEYIEKAEEYARKALDRDPESPEAHLVLGFTDQAFRGDQKKSFYHLKQALARNPDDPHTLLWLLQAHVIVGRVDEAYPLAERLARVDPLTPISGFSATFLDVSGGRFDVPSEELTKWFRLEPQNPLALAACAGLLATCSRYDEARELIQGNVRAGLEDFSTRLTLLLEGALDGDSSRFREIMTEDFRRTARRDPQWSYYVAEMHAFAGLKDEALDWLSNAVDRGYINYPLIADHDRLLESIRGEPRFRDIAARAKHEWEHFEL